jgi:predicted nuclease of predicted toxin-antitoxin system
MTFVADENFPRHALRLLRQSGFDVTSIAETNPGLPDTEVLGIASAEGRTLLTFDKDFGDLAFRQGLPASCGVILFRTGSVTPTEAADLARTGAPRRSIMASIPARANSAEMAISLHPLDSHSLTSSL